MNRESVVLAADTTVVCSGEILGKPGSETDYERMLDLLSGSTHTVLTGVSILKGGSAKTFVSATEVTFRELTASEISWYWQTGEPQDKAGGYGLQGTGSVFVASISGSHTNVIGLPLAETVIALRDAGVEFPDGRSKESKVIRGSSNV